MTTSNFWFVNKLRLCCHSCRSIYDERIRTVGALEQVSRALKSHSAELAERALHYVKSPEDEDYILEVCADLRRHSEDLSRAIEFVRDWNSRRSMPIPN